jgi:hypothetical protein
MLHGRLLLDRASAREAIDPLRSGTAFSWFSWLFGGSLVVAAVATLVLQSQFKWALLRRIGRWPGVQSMLAAVGWLWAWRALRRLPTTPGERRPEPPPYRSPGD